MKIVVIGSKGTLGSAIVQYWNSPKLDSRIAAQLPDWSAPKDELVPLNLPEFDACTRLFVVETLADFRPDVVVNASGVNLIDWLETRPNTARNVHAHAVSNLKEGCRRTGALLVQFGCGEVFYRNRLIKPENSETGVEADELAISPDAPGFSELDVPNPKSVYAKTKLESERIAAEAPKSLILRTSSLFGNSTEFSSGNIVESTLTAICRVRRASVIDDKIVEPTWAVDVACALKTLLRRRATGLYHLSGGSKATPREVAEFTLKRTGLRGREIVGISAAEYGQTAPQSAFTALRSVKIDAIDGV
ncbi:MAG: sugar nucleotide-binding protein [Thermoguttaceae bacterium]|nr:sugar nucleotide-binding protein [Thermoguttaceae bacterium]